jgi:hypothetical protein
VHAGPVSSSGREGQRLTTTGSSLPKLPSPIRSTIHPECATGSVRWATVIASRGRLLDHGEFRAAADPSPARCSLGHRAPTEQLLAPRRRQPRAAHSRGRNHHRNGPRSAVSTNTRATPSASSRQRKACGSSSTTSRCEGPESLTERQTVTIPDLMPCRTCRTSLGRHLDVGAGDGETPIGPTYRPHHADHPTNAPFSASRATERPWQRACTSR